MQVIPPKETLTIEFKSDTKGGLSDHELLDAIVCLANAEGGKLYLGVENDGTPTGLHKKHKDIGGLPAMVQNRTVPSVQVSAEIINTSEHDVAVIAVPKLNTIVATSAGTCIRRRLNHKGEPECVPFLPHEFASRLAHFGALDFSAEIVPGLTPDALDPVERARLRRTIEANALADKALLQLTDDQLDGALDFVKMVDGKPCVTYTGLLMIGRADVIKTHIPNHEVAFQAFKGSRVTVNEFYRGPLIQLQEQLDTYYRAHVIEQEVQVGMFRVAVPTVDQQAYREAVVNALTHRDLTQQGQVYIQWKDDVLSISSPGGFLNGVTPDNILTVPPTPRNPTLAAAFKRAGLSERTGRGVDLIYEGLVKYGRPLPRYDRSTATNVIVDINCGEANLKFVELVTREQNEKGKALPLESLLVLNELLDTRRASAQDIADNLPVMDPVTVRQQLELLLEAGLVQAHGVKKGRTYTMSASVYGKLDKKSDYVRQAGISSTRHKAMILEHIASYKRIRRDEVINLCGLSPSQATKLLGKMVKAGELVAHGEKRGRYYTKP